MYFSIEKPKFPTKSNEIYPGVVLDGREEGGGLEVFAVQEPLQNRGLSGLVYALARARVIREMVLST